MKSFINTRALLIGLVVAVAIGSLIFYNLYFRLPANVNTRVQRTNFSAQDMRDVSKFARNYFNWCTDTNACTIYPSERYGSFYSFSIGSSGANDSNSMRYVVQKQPDTTFKLLSSGQEPPDCQRVVQYQIPHQIEPQCYTDGVLTDNGI